MRVSNLRLAAHRGSGRFRDVAHFDIQVTEGLRLADLRLVEAPGGKRLVYAPSRNGRHFCSFSAEFAQEIAAAATAALQGGCEADDKRNR